MDYEESLQGAGILEDTGQDIVIAHSLRPLLFFGFYRIHQLPAAGWRIYQNSLDWLTDGASPGETRVVLFTYDGDPDPDTGQDDSVAAYAYLTDAGYDVTIFAQAEIDRMDVEAYDEYDLAIYSNSYPRSAAAVMEAGIPFMTIATGMTDEIEVGTGVGTLHQHQNSHFVRNNAHPITDGYDLGALQFEESMWTDATEAARYGVSLVNTDARDGGFMVHGTANLFYSGLDEPDEMGNGAVSGMMPQEVALESRTSAVMS